MLESEIGTPARLGPLRPAPFLNMAGQGRTGLAERAGERMRMG